MNWPTFTDTFDILPAVFGAMSELSSAIKLPVAWITAATTRDSLLPTVIATGGVCELLSAFALALPPRFDPDEPHAIEAAAAIAQINSFNRAFHISDLSKYRILQYFTHPTNEVYVNFCQHRSYGAIH